MFEFLFKYPPAIFSKGKFLLLSGWPLWLLLLLIVAAAAGLFWNMRQRHGLLSNPRATAIWLAQTALIALVLFMLWHPAISVARLRPQENVVAVLVDHSRSMGIADDGKPRIQSAEDLLNNTLLPDLQKRFQVRMYKFGRDAVRIDEARNLAADDNATRIGDSLKHIASEAGTMPLGAVVLLSDGGDNTGGIDRDTIAQLHALRLPVHTIGFGPDHFAKDIEIVDVAAPARALAQSRVSARVAIRQHGFAGSKVRLVVRENDHPISEQEITLKPDPEQSETIVFNAGAEGAHSFQIGVTPSPGEQNTQNNSVTRLVNVASGKKRILYIEGEPRWEFKFIRRAVEDDPGLELATVLRTTQNKIYVQGNGDKDRAVQDGFPTKADVLFQYDGLIIGSVEANYFSNEQQAMIRDFADRRGGGVLFLAGRFSLSDGAYAKTPMAEMMPLRLSNEKTWSRNFAYATLTDAGKESVITRLEEQRDQNIARWQKMPQIANYAVMGAPKPGAVVLMNVNEAGHRPTPLLAIQNYGHGRVGVFATAGSWRWKMLQDHNDRTHSEFWSQLMRWMVTETPGQVLSSTPHQVLPDDTHVPLRVSVRDKNYETVSGATVQTTIARPDGRSDTIDLRPDPLEPGMYTGEYTADKPGTYVAETSARQDKTDLGRDALTFRREDGVAENFAAAQNRDLLQKLSSDTGGSYYTPSTAKKLSGEVAVSEAGITAHDNLDLWDMPILFLLVILIRGGEWLLRRKWGVV
ncbi:MAG TPA: glutamine amidotransferase [Bryobacteraceae bacterium]|nr:glutamine amidotransferase [Bryobacteraceae bacterium]